MATISTSIQINDMMSKQFRAMNLAMVSVIDSFEQLQDVSTEAIDVSSLQAAHRELQQIEAELVQVEENLQRAANQTNRVEKEIRQAENAQKRFNGSIGEGTYEMAQMAATAAGIGAIYAGYQGASALIKTSDEMANIEARLNLVNDGLQTTAELQNLIMAAALRSDAPYMTMAGNVAKLAMNAKDAFSSTQQAVLFAELLNKQFVVAGATTMEIESATLQLTQALGSGVLRGEELNAVFEAAPNIIRRIADYLDVNVGQIREMASNGEITADIITAAIITSANEINSEFESMGTTYARMWQNFKTAAILAFQPVTDKLNEIVNSEKFYQMTMTLVGVMIILGNILAWVLDISYSGLTFMYDHWSIIAPVILSVGGAILTIISLIGLMKAAMMAYAVYQLIVAATNPFILAIAGIILLIGLFYVAISTINTFAGTSISATGIIAMTFMGLYSVFYNVIVFMINAGMMFAEFLVNFLRNPVYSVKNLFGSLAQTAIDMAISMIGSFDSVATNLANAFVDGANMAIGAINWIIDALNQIPDVNIGKIGPIGRTGSVTTSLSGLKTNISDWVGEMPSDYFDASSQFELDYRATADDIVGAYNWGANLFDFSGAGAELLNFDKYQYDDSTQNIVDAINAGNGAAEDTAGNTKKLADSVDMLEEDVAYLRDIAEREVINRYTTGHIKIDMKNENYINSELDIDGVIDRFGERAEEVANMLAEDGDNLDV